MVISGHLPRSCLRRYPSTAEMQRTWQGFPLVYRPLGGLPHLALDWRPALVVDLAGAFRVVLARLAAEAEAVCLDLLLAPSANCD